jgi:hypothetical protein
MHTFGPPTNLELRRITHGAKEGIRFAAQVLLKNDTWGHIQTATILRDVGIENTFYTTGTAPALVAHPSNHDDVFGWGVQVSGVFNPFANMEWLKRDHINFLVMYGEGIANYDYDLRGLNYDAAFTLSRQLKALPLLSYYLAYEHYWTDHFRSTVVYSEVDLDSIVSPGATASPYRHGRYVAANLIYQWDFSILLDPTQPPDPKNTKSGRGFAGIEYLYGQKESLNRGSGDDHRVQFTVGFKY